jgi:hypothetical protein
MRITAIPRYHECLEWIHPLPCSLITRFLAKDEGSGREIHGTFEAQFGVDIYIMGALQAFCRTIPPEGELLTGLIRSGDTENRKETTLLFVELEKVVCRSLRSPVQPPTVSFSAVFCRLRDPLGVKNYQLRLMMELVID